MSRILLLGANGQVGHKLRSSLCNLGELFPTTRSGVVEDDIACEIADFDQPESLASLVDRISPDIVVNAAAYTAVDRAEDDAAAAFRANAEAPEVLARTCKSRDALLVHYSTDYVFDGQARRPYLEVDATAPLGVYGASKLEGEQAIRASGCRHMIFRTAWVYGHHGNNFMRTMLRLGAERDVVRVVADQFGSPTPAALIAEVSAHALRSNSTASGTWNLTAKGETSWHGFAEAIFTRAHARGMLAKLPVVTGITTAEYPTRARRPAYSCLDTHKLEQDFGVVLPDWQSALAGVLDSSTG
ncbi:MAG: dTDP-4-dehydrorhamnose reductase [Pseudoxanthomonas sp.]|nr:dTDP-4-dehydrorhamnose reductase [Pseudoxanthomonas sp.]